MESACTATAVRGCPSAVSCRRSPPRGEDDAKPCRICVLESRSSVLLLTYSWASRTRPSLTYGKPHYHNPDSIRFKIAFANTCATCGHMLLPIALSRETRLIAESNPRGSPEDSRPTSHEVFLITRGGSHSYCSSPGLAGQSPREA